MTRKKFVESRDFESIRAELMEVIKCDSEDVDTKIRAAAEWRHTEKLRLEVHKFNLSQFGEAATPEEAEGEDTPAALHGLRIVHRRATA